MMHAGCQPQAWQSHGCEAWPWDSQQWDARGWEAYGRGMQQQGACGWEASGWGGYDSEMYKWDVWKSETLAQEVSERTRERQEAVAAR